MEAGPGHRELAYRSGNRRYIDHAQMTVAEPVRVESRGGYFAGAHGKSDEFQTVISGLFAPAVSIVFDQGKR